MVSSMDIVEAILRCGADPNAKNHHLETPVHFACKVAQCQKIHILLQFGGDITLLDHSGFGCLWHAFQSGHL